MGIAIYIHHYLANVYKTSLADSLGNTQKHLFHLPAQLHLFLMYLSVFLCIFSEVP